MLKRIPRPGAAMPVFKSPLHAGGKPALILHRLAVSALPYSSPSRGLRHVGRLRAGPLWFACALGKNGITTGKREGDHASPRGIYRLICAFYRADRLPRPASLLPIRRLTRSMGWCDDAQSFAYNRPLTVPAPIHHETLWREDGLYDLILVLDHNQCPRIRGRGSAIFVHCARPDRAPTEGCIALPREVLRKLLPRLSRACQLRIG